MTKTKGVKFPPTLKVGAIIEFDGGHYRVMRVDSYGGKKHVEITPADPKNPPRLDARDWYAFKVGCDLYDIGMSNMSAPSKQEYCRRPRKRGSADSDLRCTQAACPKLKGEA